MNLSMAVLVAGASSQLGVFLLPRLQDAGFEVCALSRRAPTGPVPVSDRISWARPGSESESAGYLVSCGPIDLARSLIGQHSHLKKAVVFSTSSTLTKPDSGDRREREIVAAISEEEGRLKSLCRDRGVALVLLRPTLIYGCGLDGNVSLLLKLGERLGFIPLSTNSKGLRQPVHADDLAQLAVSALLADTGTILEGEAFGGSTLSFREMVEIVAGCGNRRIRLLPLPVPLLKSLVQATSFFGSAKGINVQMVRRQATDMVFDDTLFRDTLGYEPRPFNPTPEDFRISPDLEQLRLPL
jgi:nucleoside-diphosphate-sugar epimerase